jgi:hypothetical protein
VLSWFAVDREAPGAYKAASYKAYMMCFGTSGMFEQDDVENWTSVTHVSKGIMAERLNLHSRMGLKRDGTTVSQPIFWPAPGRAYVGFGEYNQRALLEAWCDLMAADDSGPTRMADASREGRRRVATLE